MKTTRFFYVLIAVAVLFACEQKNNTLFRKLDTADTGISFENTIVESDTFNILTEEYIYNGGGVGIGDFNNDGLPDIFFVGNMVPNQLYLNKGNMQFENVTSTANVNVPGRWNSGVAVVDINQDGWLDIYVTATFKGNAADRRNMLFVNNGPGAENIPTFTERAAEYGIDDDGYSVHAAFFDADLDGDLDLYVLTNQRLLNIPSNYRPKITDGSSPNNDRLYRNNGDGTFTNISGEAGIVFEGFGLGLAISDFNLDGWPDIYVSNDYTSNDLLFINNQDGTFTNKLREYIAHSSQFSMGSDVADFNNDALPDLVTVDMLAETNDRKKTTIGNKSYLTYINNEKYGYEYQYMRNMLHVNNGLDKGVKFSEIGLLAGIYQTDWSWAPLFADLDNDGFKDLVVTNGFPKDVTDKDFSNYRNDVGHLATPGFLNDSIPVIKLPNYAFRNSGTLRFEDYTVEWGLGERSFTNGASFVDLDNDGDLDYVMNNINDKAFVYENTLNTAEATRRNFLRIQLKGDQGNVQAIGAKVTVFMNEGNLQYHEHVLTRGFLSSVESTIHFGLDSLTSVDSILVEWPGGKRQRIGETRANQTLTISFSPDAIQKRNLTVPSNKIFVDVSSKSKVAFKHTEIDYIDYNSQRTMPHKFSQSGPPVAVGDLNGDGYEDFVVGGSVNYWHTVFLQNKHHTFSQVGKNEKDPTKKQEDTSLLLFDADNDGDLDLYVVAGGVEGTSPADYQDRLYLNNGKGEFSLETSLLPEITSSGSCARAADFDNDGDLDVFVGGRIIPGSYPLPPKSYLLRNDGGKFTDVTATNAKELLDVGMVTDALWSDFNADGKIDLIVVGEFMPVTFFENKGGSLQKHADTGISGYVGWWTSIVGGDFDHDGDIDFVAGNLGLNNSFHVSAQHPLKIFAKDIDNNGSVDPVLACYVRESMESDEKKLYAVHFWDELNSQSPKFRKKFPNYKKFSKVTLEELLTPDERDGALKMEANFMASAYIENKGSGKFSIKELPMQTQIAPINGMVVDDVNNDGNADVVMVGNDYGNEVFIGRYDAFTGCVLLGDGKGTFSVMPSAKNGFYVPGDAKALVKIQQEDTDLFLASQNQDSLKLFSVTKTGTILSPLSLETHAEVVFSDGKKQRIEFPYGSGFASQSSRRVRLVGVREAVFFDAQGKTRRVEY